MRLFCISLFAVFFCYSPSSLAQEGGGPRGEVVTFQSSVTEAPWSYTYQNDAFRLAEKLDRIYVESAGAPFLESPENVNNGRVVLDAQGRLLAYVHNFGIFNGTQWSIAIDPDVTNAQRRKIQEFAAAYIQSELTRTEQSWKDVGALFKKWNVTEIKILYADAPQASREWLASIFTKFEKALIFDRATNQIVWPGHIALASAAQDAARSEAPANTVVPFQKPIRSSPGRGLKCMDIFGAF